jgi:type I restriction enzyme S subunit
MADSSLADACEIVMGQSPPGESCNTSGIGLPLLNDPTEYGPHHPSPVQFTTDVRKRAKPGDVLFCVRGSTTGRMNWADQEYAIGRGVAAIRHRSNPDLQPFVRAVIEYGLPDLLAQATGSTFPNVSADQLAMVPWPECEEHEQRAIAHILGTLDDKIELNRRMSETLEAMARALFKSWFVDFDPVRAKMEGRDPGLPKPLADLFPARLVDSELGEIPEGWGVKKFGDVVEQLRDSENPLESPDVVFHHFSIPAFDDGRWPKQELGESIKSLKSRVPPRVVLLSKLNPEIERVWLVDVEPGARAICSTEFLVLAPRAPHGRAFVYCLARSPLFRQELEGLVTGTSKSHQRAQVASILGLAVAMPPASLVSRFEYTAEPLLARSLECRRESHTLSALRDALLPKLISGELRVKDAERFIGEALA